MTDKVRTFDFGQYVTLGEALRTIRAALDDEGLVLSDANTTGDRPYSVRMTVDGQPTKRVFVPASRIHERLRVVRD